MALSDFEKPNLSDRSIHNKILLDEKFFLFTEHHSPSTDEKKTNLVQKRRKNIIEQLIKKLRIGRVYKN